MVRSTVADSITNMLRGIASAPTALAQTRSRELLNQDATQKLERQANLDLIDEIEGAGNYRVDPTGTDGQLFRYDFARLAQERPELAKRVLNSDPRFNIATDEKGRKISTQVDSFVRNEDGSYSILVTRPDGRRVPVTEGRTAQDNDVVAKFSPEDFSKIGSRRITAIRGADGAATYFRDMAGLTDEMIAAEATEAIASSPISEDPAALSGMASIINTAEGEDLYAIATELGVDVDAIRQSVADSNPQVQPDPVAEDTATEEVATESPTEQKSTYDTSGLDPNLPSTALIKEAEKGGTKRVVAGLGGVAETTSDPLAPLRKRKAQIEARLAPGPRGQNAKYRLGKERFEKDTADLEQINQYLGEVEAIDDSEPKAVEPTPPGTISAEENAEIDAEIARQKAEKEQEPSTLEKEGIAPKAPLNTDEQVREAIRNKLAEPTEQQALSIQRMLQQNNVQSPEDLRKLTPKDAYMAVWLASSRQPGSTADKLNVANVLLNLVQTGSMELNPNDVAKTQIDRGALATRRAELRRGLNKDFQEQLEKLGDKQEEAFEALSTVRLELTDEDGEFIEPTREATNGVVDIWNKAAGVDGSTMKAAYQSVAIDALVHHMAALANSNYPGWLEFADKFDNWFSDENQLRIGRNALPGLVRVVTDGQGKVSAISFRDPDGAGTTNWSIPVGLFQEQYGDKVLQQVIALGRKNTASERQRRADPNG